jgi:hypothetical protein
MRKLALLLATIAALVLPQASFGQGPITGVCSFPFTIEQTRGQGDMTHSLPGMANAPFLASGTGQVFVVITNLDNGKSIEVNVSGPIFFTANGVVLTGASLFFFAPPLVVTGDIPVGLILTAGPVLVTGGGGTVHTELLGGTIRANLCDVLTDP